MAASQAIGLNLIVFNFALVVVCVAVSVLGVFINESNAWYLQSFKSFVRSNKSNSKATITRALLAQRFEDLAVALQADTKRLAQQLDRHMIWLSAGAIFFIVQFLREGPAANGDVLAFGFVYFIFCIGAVVTSYFLQHEALLRAAKAPRAAQRVMDIIEDSFPKTFREVGHAKGFVAASGWWNYLRWQIILTRLSSFLMVIFNGLAYFAFLVGMVSFAVYMLSI